MKEIIEIRITPKNQQMIEVYSDGQEIVFSRDKIAHRFRELGLDEEANMFDQHMSSLKPEISPVKIAGNISFQKLTLGIKNNIESSIENQKENLIFA